MIAVSKTTVKVHGPLGRILWPTKLHTTQEPGGVTKIYASDPGQVNTIACDLLDARSAK